MRHLGTQRNVSSDVFVVVHGEQKVLFWFMTGLFGFAWGASLLETWGKWHSTGSVTDTLFLVFAFGTMLVFLAVFCPFSRVLETDRRNGVVRVIEDTLVLCNVVEIPDPVFFEAVESFSRCGRMYWLVVRTPKGAVYLLRSSSGKEWADALNKFFGFENAETGRRTGGGGEV